MAEETPVQQGVPAQDYITAQDATITQLINELIGVRTKLATAYRELEQYRKPAELKAEDIEENLENGKTDLGESALHGAGPSE